MTHVVTDSDVDGWLPHRDPNSNKWSTAVCVAAGSPGMFGAAMLASEAAMRSGAGMVRLCSPGADAKTFPPSEVVGVAISIGNWSDAVVHESERCHSLLIGPGLGRSDETIESIRSTLLKVSLPAIVDADGLYALGGVSSASELFRDRGKPSVLTPHDGEFERIAERPVNEDREADVKWLANELDATVLLKGPTTIISNPDGETLLVENGDARLATAGTGDVLSGIIGAFLAQGMEPLRAASAAAHVHGGAAMLGPERGLVAHDLLDLIPQWFSQHLPG